MGNTRLNVWRVLLLASCAALSILALVGLLMFTGVGGAPPFVGLWGNTVGASSAPFELRVQTINPGGPSDRAGLRVGDRIDIRANPPLERFWLFGQPIVAHPVTVLVRRDASQERLTIEPGTQPLANRWALSPIRLGTVWLLTFAALIAWRRASLREMRLLCLVLVSYGLWEVTGPRFIGATATWAYVLFGLGNVVGTLCLAFWAATAGCFAEPRSRLRTYAQWGCYAFLAVSMALGIARIVAVTTLQLDPIALSSPWSGLPFVLAFLCAIICTVLSIAAATGADRQRAIWSLVPPALLILAGYGGEAFQGVSTSYALSYFPYYVASVIDFATPATLMYVALNRRLLDVGFALNRAAVFAVISAIVVGTFVLVEWAASAWLVNASHTTSAIIGAAVVLALGLSMRYIHTYVDRFVDRVFFRKRHEDEAALRKFAHEAAFITDRSTLLERAAQEVRDHTDAGDASILLFDSSTSLDENDPAIVAMRAWHKPVDLHTQPHSALRGDMAFPMVSRGRLIGALVCAPKREGESYAPDESDALRALAHGVGMALDTLSEHKTEHKLDLILSELAELKGMLRV